MQKFTSDGVELAYIDSGAGDPVLLIHGFASNVAMNWTGPGWVKTLTQAGYRVIAFDNRGHGQSEKLYAPEDYGAPLMARDAITLLRHLDIHQIDVMGYSMGARITAFLALQQPTMVRSCIFGGLGINMITPMGGTDHIAQALEAASIDEVIHPTARTFRAFAEQTGSDLLALAACIKSAREAITADALSMLTCPVLVATGSDDKIGGSATQLAELIPVGQALTIAGRDHMRAVGDKSFKVGVLNFLATRA